MIVKIKEIESLTLDENQVDTYSKFDFLLKSKKISRRDFFKNVLLLSGSYVIINNGIIQNVTYAFWSGVIVRFIAGQFFRRNAVRSLAGSFAREVAANVAADIVVDGAKQFFNHKSPSVSTIDYGTRYMERNDSSKLESVSDTINLAELFGDAVWRKNDVDNPASIIVTNYNDKSMEIPNLNMFLKDIHSRNNELSTKVTNLGEVAAASESLINLGVKDLPYTGLKKLEGDNSNVYSSNRILVAENNDADKSSDERGMSVEELYKIYLENGKK